MIDEERDLSTSVITIGDGFHHRVVNYQDKVVSLHHHGDHILLSYWIECRRVGVRHKRFFLYLVAGVHIDLANLKALIRRKQDVILMAKVAIGSQREANVIILISLSYFEGDFQEEIPKGIASR